MSKKTNENFNEWLKNYYQRSAYGNYFDAVGVYTRKELYKEFVKEIQMKNGYEPIDNTIPSHYQTDKDFDVIDFCHLYNLNFARGSAIKYIARAGKKDNEIEDLKKAIDFLERELKKLKDDKE